MKKWDILLRVLGLRRGKPQTRLGKVWRWSGHGITALAVIYLFFALFPQVLLGHSFSAQGVRILSTRELPGDRETLLAQIRARMEKSGLLQPQDRFTLCLCNSPGLYAFFTPKNARAFASTNPLTGKIFVAHADLERNLCRAYRADHNERSFVGVATHEMGHRLMSKRFGLVRHIRTPRWIKEGYCEYLAGESSFPEAEGDRLLAQGNCGRGGAFSYFLYRRMMEYLIDGKGLSIRQIMANPPREQQVREETCRWLRTRASAPPAGPTEAP